MSGNTPIPAAILAGGDATDRVAATEGVPCKALVKVGGTLLVSRVAEAVRAAVAVNRLVVVEGPSGPLTASGMVSGEEIVTAQGPGFLDTLTAAAQAYPDAERLLVVTADLPLLTSEAVDGFIASCQDTQAELSYPLVRLEEFERVFPGRGKFTVPLREGRFIGANLVVMSRRFILEQGPVIARTFARRKNIVGLCRMFGLRFLVLLAMGRLSVSDLERRASEILGTRARAVPAPWPEIAFDVDDVDDLALARHFVQRRAG